MHLFIFSSCVVMYIFGLACVYSGVDGVALKLQDPSATNISTWFCGRYTGHRLFATFALSCLLYTQKEGVHASALFNRLPYR